MGLELILVVEGVVGAFREAHAEVAELVDLADLQVAVEQIDRFTEEGDADLTTVLVLDISEGEGIREDRC